MNSTKSDGRAGESEINSVDLKARTATGIAWNFLELLSTRGVTLIVTLLLARFLAPEDFGLLAIMAVFIAIASALMDSGTQQALIRMPAINQKDYDTAFILNLALGAMAYALLLATAPLIATFFGEPRLVILIRVAGIVVLINAFQVVQSAVLSRKLNFKRHLQAAIPAAIVSGGLAVLAAWQGAGVWALIIQMVANAALFTFTLWKMQGWCPTWRFDGASAKHIYQFGYKLFLSGLLDTAFKNLYIVVIAKVFTAGIAGLYFFASRIKVLIVSLLVTAIQRVTYPALASVQHDDARLKSGYRQVMQVTTFILFPALLFTAALAAPIFHVLFPEQWYPAIPFFQLMCVVALLYPLHAVNLNILKVKGRSDLFLGVEIIKKLMGGSVFFLTYQYGVIVILLGHGISSLLAYLPNSYFSTKLISYSVREQLRDTLPALLIAGGIGSMVYWSSSLLNTSPLLKIVLLGPSAGGLYLLAAKMFSLPAYHLTGHMLKRLNRKVEREPHEQ